MTERFYRTDDSDVRLDDEVRRDYDEALQADQPEEGIRADQPEATTPLLAPDRTEVFRERWEEIQTHFVDEPRQAVREADQLVGEIMTALENSFSEHKGQLEDAWNRGEEADTEALRLTLQKYRRLFGRLLVA